ncbi:hypothetical protein CF67_03051 [Candidatus Photodesmus blepharus]|uniref:Peptidase S54 rhomboid domain-containing protein n=1 Tax=Candidatus Photodesmus blepharonis TaxID=1179155 RepID=A0A084CN52_9GAMM|nr:rhombosortase [Candidatus Photodesmus blepharus]KEY91231.1 hypothetical protein CF67_03051 [Candidatus Photodesmus blepharus]
MLRPFFVWNRHSIISGEWWRILTGSFTHANFIHLCMNLVGLWFIANIFRPSPRLLILLIIFLATLIGVGLFFTDITNYSGLSGVLYGVFGYLLFQKSFLPFKISAFLVLGLFCKIVWEHTLGDPGLASSFIDARIAIESHLFGLIGSFVLILVKYFRKK